ncbi:MAG: putative peptide modification system cyclase [Rhodanobacteraceae bacterium]|jgi:putative peptide modification system cyclase|nr:putative peptide modification system cyclase [Rhodanobacteraceae bacterium]
MNAIATTAASAQAPASPPLAAPLLRTLVLSDLVDSTALIERLGDLCAAELVRRHDRLVRTLAPQHGGREIDKTDGFLLLFERPIQAVAFALAYQRDLKALGRAEGVELAARIGIHVGDVLTWDNAPADVAQGAKPVEVEGLVKPITARLMQLALPNQILLSGVAHALAHRAQGELGAQLRTVRWRTHGRYRFKGIPDPIPVFEVGEEGLAPLKAPPWSGKAHREVPFWRRPASLAFEALALLVLLVVPAWYLLKPAPAIAFADRDWVVVGDLKNLTDEPAFNDSVGTAFRIGLEQSRYVNVLSDLKVRQTLALMKRDPNQTALDRAVGSEIAIRDGARALILPTIAEIGGRVRVTAEVIDPNTQTTVWSESADGTGADSVLPSLDQVNQKLRVRLGEALATVTKDSKPLEKAATKNLDALRAYSLAASEHAKGNVKQAISLYRQAITFDSQFALARIDLGSALSLTSAGDFNEAISEFRKAVALSDRLSARDALYAQAWLANFESPRTALEKWRLLARMYPDFTRGSGGAGYFSYQSANDFDAAILATEQNAVATNPRRGTGDYLLATLYLGNERYSDAQRRFASAADNGVSNQGIYESYLYAAQRQFGRAEQILAGGKASGITGDDEISWYPRITLALDRGHWDEARTAVARARQETATLKGVLHAEYTLIELGLRALTEPKDAFKPVLADYLKTLAASKTRESPDAQFSLLFAAYLAAHVDSVDLAQSALTGVAPVSRSGDYPYLSSLLAVVEAELARANGQPQQTVAMLKPHIDGREYYFSHSVLMDAYAAQGDYANALAEANWLARHRGRAYVEQFGQIRLRPFNVALSDLALLNAAEFSARLNKPDVARKALGDLRQAWPGADRLPFLQQRLQTLDAGLAAKPSAP